MMAEENDAIVRRIVVEYGRLYVYAYYTDGNAKVLEEEVWQQPFRLDAKDAHDEAKDIWQFLYQELQDTVLHSTASSDEDEAESDEED
jgi:hypothetical protein